MLLKLCYDGKLHSLYTINLIIFDDNRFFPFKNSLEIKSKTNDRSFLTRIIFVQFIRLINQRYDIFLTRQTLTQLSIMPVVPPGNICHPGISLTSIISAYYTQLVFHCIIQYITSYKRITLITVYYVQSEQLINGGFL